MGRLKKIKISSANTTIIGGGAARKTRSTGAPIRSAAKSSNTDSEYDREKLQERLAKLAGGVAQINCGAATETEMKERKALLEDAKCRHASCSGRRHCSRRRRCLDSLRKALDKLEARRRRSAGRADHSQRLDYPLRAIANNAGVDGAVVVNRVRQMKGKNDGYNADTNSYGDLVEAGVIDPAKVVRTCLQNAASVASLLLTTSSLITEIPVEEEEAGGDHHHDHGMGGMGGMDGWAVWVVWDGGMGGMGGMM